MTLQIDSFEHFEQDKTPPRRRLATFPNLLSPFYLAGKGRAFFTSTNAKCPKSNATKWQDYVFQCLAISNIYPTA